MKRYIVLMLLPVFILVCKSSTAQQPFLTIYYYYGEKSKDSHSTTENVSINGNAVTYSVKYSGRRGSTQVDEVKTCTLTPEQIAKINKTINDKQLAVSDSVIINNEAHNSGFGINITVLLTLIRSGKTTRVKTKGNPFKKKYCERPAKKS